MSHAPSRIEDSVLDDLRRRLAATRAPRLPAGAGWERGTDAEYLADLLDCWRDDYDWRAHEQRILALPWRRTAGARCIHQAAPGGDATAVVLLHGWPDSVLRYERVLPLLEDLEVVVPALPGYPFAPPLTQTGMSATAMAAVVAAQLAELGVDRYVVSGGDIGALVAETLAAEHPDRVAALHLTDVPLVHMAGVDPSALSAAERDHLAGARGWRAREGAYMHMQATKPHTAAAGLADSPAGLAAWIIEKLRSWTGCGGDLESVFTRDELLTWVTAYWVTNTIGTSFSPYFERYEPPRRVSVPTVVTQFPHDIAPAPRAFAERFFDVRVWDEQPSGGHFGAWERPQAFAAGVRAAIALA